MTGVALAVATPPFPWYAMLLVMLVAFDGRVEWLGLAMVRYLAVSDPLPGVHVPVLDALRAAYGLALAVVVAAALIRRHRSRTLAQPALASRPPGARSGGRPGFSVTPHPGRDSGRRVGGPHSGRASPRGGDARPRHQCTSWSRREKTAQPWPRASLPLMVLFVT